jgi:hypothetical protein
VNLRRYQTGVTLQQDAPDMRLFPVLFLASLSAAQAASNPAPMNGIWQLTQMTQMTQTSRTTPGDARLPMPAGELFIVSGQVRGNYGCGRYQGTLNAAANTVMIQVNLLPPRPTERCLFAGRNPAATLLNAATQYTLSQGHLVLFSKVGRLTFERVGFVTPGKK